MCWTIHIWYQLIDHNGVENWKFEILRKYCQIESPFTWVRSVHLPIYPHAHSFRIQYVFDSKLDRTLNRTLNIQWPNNDVQLYDYCDKYLFEFIQTSTHTRARTLLPKPDKFCEFIPGAIKLQFYWNDCVKHGNANDNGNDNSSTKNSNKENLDC